MPDRDYVPECNVILVGSGNWDATPVAPGDCPACGKGIHEGDDTYYCARCDSCSPAKEARIRAVLLGIRRKSKLKARAEKAARDVELAKAKFKRRPTVLAESTRRRVWNGYRGSLVREWSGDLNNEAKEGRDFLRDIGQEPNWSLVLKRRGRITGTADPGILP